MCLYIGTLLMKLSINLFVEFLWPCILMIVCCPAFSSSCHPALRQIKCRSLLSVPCAAKFQFIMCIMYYSTLSEICTFPAGKRQQITLSRPYLISFVVSYVIFSPCPSLRLAVGFGWFGSARRFRFGPVWFAALLITSQLRIMLLVYWWEKLTQLWVHHARYSCVDRIASSDSICIRFHGPLSILHCYSALSRIITSAIRLFTAW